MSASDRDNALRFLELALSEAQATVRGYDTKAQIVGIGYTFALNIVANVGQGFPRSADGSMLALVIFWVFLMLPIWVRISFAAAIAIYLIRDSQRNRWPGYPGQEDYQV